MTPHVYDDRRAPTRFAAEPDLVTPTGLSIDGQNRLFVLEPHTHLSPSDYDGPAGDRVKIFSDPDGDGQPDESTVFAEGIDDSITLAFSPDGWMYVSHG